MRIPDKGQTNKWSPLILQDKYLDGTVSLTPSTGKCKTYAFPALSRGTWESGWVKWIYPTEQRTKERRVARKDTHEKGRKMLKVSR